MFLFFEIESFNYNNVNNFIKLLFFVIIVLRVINFFVK